ncbi:hypothetical protein [uncultured Muribaculum sp.]|uniref:hypothetical protein n=1 Tax=uncultured Muribaculum sp. TaxID=1918613 RepID=UPI0025AF1ED2|nr:hypothetical protein [uncultured Muribaculum sp.]
MKNNKIIPVNNMLYDSMFVKELESRLESDPLFPGGLLELNTPEFTTLSANDTCTSPGALNCDYTCNYSCSYTPEPYPGPDSDWD